MKIEKVWVLVVLMAVPQWLWAQTEGFALSFGGAASMAYTSIPLKPNGGFGLSGDLEYDCLDGFGAGLDIGLVEYIAPTGQADMKSAWADLTARLFPFPASGLGRPYWRMGFGFSPFVAGLFGDYWPNYAAAQLGGPASSAAIYWNAQTSIGYRFFLSQNWALDTEAQYNLFWPPAAPLLQTLSLQTRLVLFLGK